MTIKLSTGFKFLLTFLKIRGSRHEIIISRTQLLGLVLGLSLTIPSATAATISILDPGTLFPVTLVRYITGGAETDDIRGFNTLAVSNPGPVGAVFLSYSMGGTDPNGAFLPF